MNQEPEVVLRLPVSKLEYIGAVLGARPYSEVAALLADIQQQLAAQQQAPAAPALHAVQP